MKRYILAGLVAAILALVIARPAYRATHFHIHCGGSR